MDALKAEENLTALGDVDDQTEHEEGTCYYDALCSACEFLRRRSWLEVPIASGGCDHSQCVAYLDNHVAVLAAADGTASAFKNNVLDTAQDDLRQATARVTDIGEINWRDFLDDDYSWAELTAACTKTVLKRKGLLSSCQAAVIGYEIRRDAANETQIRYGSRDEIKAISADGEPAVHRIRALQLEAKFRQALKDTKMIADTKRSKLDKYKEETNNARVTYGDVHVVMVAEITIALKRMSACRDHECIGMDVCL